METLFYTLLILGVLLNTIPLIFAHKFTLVLQLIGLTLIVVAASLIIFPYTYSGVN